MSGPTSRPAAEQESARAKKEKREAALRQIRESAEALLREGKTEESWELLLSALEAVLARNTELEWLVAKLQRTGRKRSSEKLDPAQLQLLFDLMGEQADRDEGIDPEEEAAEDAALDAEIEEAEQARSGERKGRKRKERPGWTTRGAEQEVHEVEVAPEQRTCTECGREKKRIGEDVTRRLEFVPAQFVEHEYRLAKYACGYCKEGVTTAPGPPQVIERSAAGASLLAHLVVAKYVDHVPLHRLHRIYKRHGAEIPVSTLADWTAGVGDLVEPLVERLAERVRGAYVVRTDSTGLAVLDPESPANIQRGTIWAYVGDDRDVVFRYTPTGEAATGPWEFLAGREGYIQADAASVFDRLFKGKVASATEVGCWSHTRRKLEALKDMDCRVAYPLKLIARLYRIEHLADARGLDPEGRAQLRQHRSQSLLAKLAGWYATTAESEPPSSELAKAARYAINHWEALNRFVRDGRLSPDNNLCEQQLRDIALGRKNYLFAGSHEGARRTANLYSLTRTCAQYGVLPLPYLTDILAKLGGGWPAERLDDLLPHNWSPPGRGP